jgi:sRNA-binding protein
MMRKIFVLALLSLSLAACEPSSTDNNSNANKASSDKPVTATPALASPTPEAVASVNPQLKAGDKVKVTINGSATDATVVSVDEKAGKVTVKIQGQKEDKTVAIGVVVKE